MVDPVWQLMLPARRFGGRQAPMVALSGDALHRLFQKDWVFTVVTFVGSAIALASLGFRREQSQPACEQPRAIIVGDVHGCARELRALLRRARPRAGCDLLYFTGDLIGKGPASLEAMREVRALSLSGLEVTALLGNWEAGFLRWLDARRASGSAAAPASANAHEREFALWATSLSSDEFVWLRERPLRATLPAEYGDVAVVHAGMEPGTPPQEQRRDTLLTVRSLLPNGTASAAPGRHPTSAHSSWAASWKGPQVRACVHATSLASARRRTPKRS
jgi:hypothetical protein